MSFGFYISLGNYRLKVETTNIHERGWLKHSKDVYDYEEMHFKSTNYWFYLRPLSFTLNKRTYY